MAKISSLFKKLAKTIPRVQLSEMKWSYKKLYLQLLSNYAQL